MRFVYSLRNLLKPLLKKASPDAVLRFLAASFGVCFVLSVLFSAVIYGVSVYFETRTVDSGKDARNMEEENMTLRVDLDKLRSYQNVAEKNLQTTALKPAEQKLTITVNPKAVMPKVEPEPDNHLVFAYGY